MDIVMPQMGESLAEGTVTAWFKAPGDSVARDEPLLEIETDKVGTVIDSPVDGTLVEITTQPGETVPVGATLGRLATADQPDGQVTPEDSTNDGAPKAHLGHGDRTEVVSFRSRPSRAAAVAGPRYSPAVLAAAAERDIPVSDLASLTATGRGGRLSVRDVMDAVHSGRSGSGRDPASRSATPAEGGVTPPTRYIYEPTPRDTVIPMSATRRQIADHMSWSRRISAHATAFDEIEVGDLARWIAESNEGGERGRARVTWTAAIAHACVLCLGDFPYLNASVVGDQVALRPYVHLGIAVAVDDELVVPVITDAHLVDLFTLADRLADVTARARSRQLGHGELGGGTFTFSNPGIAGGLFGTPILHQPQVAILSANAVRDRPWVVDGSVVARPVMGVSVSFDHRLVDGMMAFSFIEALRDRLADPDRLAESRYRAKGLPMGQP